MGYAGGLSHRHRSVAALGAVLGLLAGLLAWGQRGAPREAEHDQPLASSQAGSTVEVALSNPAVSVAKLLKEGDFDGFVNRALAVAAEHPRDADALRLCAEALLAVARSADAERSALAAAFVPHQSSQAVAAALQLWLTARLRQGLSPALPQVDHILAHINVGQPRLASLRFLRRELAGDAPFSIAGDARSASLDLKESTAWAGFVSHQIQGIEIGLNGVTMPLAFVDTGAQHTFITSQAARVAGVTVGEEETELVGFASAVARPGLVRELRIGTLVVRNVPVYVCDTQPLILARGQAALGIDLLHHLRVEIDYASHTACFAPAANPAASAHATPDEWSIPLWTFSQACLAQARLPGGVFARTLVDTGNRIGTFASGRWSRDNLLTLRRPTTPLLPWFKGRRSEVVELEIAGRRLENWPIRGVLPEELDRLDVVDLLVGQDLLSDYRVTIDLRCRVMQLDKSDHY